MRLNPVLLPADDPGPVQTPPPYWRRGVWRARWLQTPAGAVVPFVAAYRLRFDLAAPLRVRLHVSLAERGFLFTDGRRSAPLPERGSPHAWRFASFDLEADAGRHVLAALLLGLGDHGPFNQATLRPGFLLEAEGEGRELLSTGLAAWECRLLPAYAFAPPRCAGITGARPVIDGAALPWGWETGAGDGFVPAIPGESGHSRGVSREPDPPVLVATRLPPQRDEPVGNGTALLVTAGAADEGPLPLNRASDDLATERPAWQALLDGRVPLIIAPGTSRRCLVDLGAYRCLWPMLHASGTGGRIHLRYAEALYLPRPDGRPGREKHDRRVWEGKVFEGVGPTLLTTAGSPRPFAALDWECGRYLEIRATAGSEPLTLARLDQRQTGYPLADDGAFACDDPRLEDVRRLCVETLRVGTHETFCDCPYHERLQYVGDTRIEALVAYCLQRDDRLQRQAIEAFADNLQPGGLVPSRAPGRGVQIIPPFALWWIHLLDDYACWRRDPAFIRRHLGVVHSILDVWLAGHQEGSLAPSPHGWNFIDWVPGWEGGMPPGGDHGVCHILNWHLVWTLGVAADLEEVFGQAEYAGLYRRHRQTLIATLHRQAWDDVRHRWRDTPAGEGASEHGQILALLSGGLQGERFQQTARSLLDDADLARCTIYHLHYLFEAHRLLGRTDRLCQRLDLWFGLSALGLTTTPEAPEPARSDCHPWGTHPLFHQIATLAGMRPGGYGFTTLEITPCPGPLRRLELRLPHPDGEILARIQALDEGGRWRMHLTTPVPARTPAGLVPAGVHVLEWKDATCGNGRPGFVIPGTPIHSPPPYPWKPRSK